MRKQEFLYALRRQLSRLPAKEASERVNFYSEMIDDKMEDGLSEEAAVREVGSTEKIAAEILADTRALSLANAEPTKKFNTGTLILLVLGSPIWLSLAIAAFAVVISLYAALFSVIIALWAVFVSFVAAAPASVIVGIIFAFCGNVLSGIVALGAGLVLAGLAIFLFYDCKAATKGTLLLTKWSCSQIANLFRRKETI